MESKARLRRETLAVLEALPPATRGAASLQACARFRQQKAWLSSKSVMLFAPLPDELDIWPLVEVALASGKTVALPRYSKSSRHYTAAVVRDLGDDLCIGHFGVREPSAACEEIPLNRLDLVLVPGVAFDLHGRRVGRGKGHYDRLLADVRGVKCGVAFDEQLVDEVPVGPQDVPLNCILTPTRWVECPPARGS
jgi:5-formyltetrahydrofolate cyclo-ligase